MGWKLTGSVRSDKRGPIQNKDRELLWGPCKKLGTKVYYILVTARDRTGQLN